ncbi:MAG: hypothetical protein A4E57_02842 [Syntrophorhabdaceae bacterium PtaU1.Bin034]|jgi:hypothetical protein|nr:MAG: hypothetical protein A4E57_02842 [Syntrophorhabdaceae bacterium PtaU1.Bin034]
MEMPKISKCEVTECSYNQNALCHAIAITVGGDHPVCDTFCGEKAKGGVADATGSVGACKESDCKFNESLECSAPSITVAHHYGHADCATFTQDKNLGLP